MTVHPRAGTVATEDDLIDPAALVTAYYTTHPDPGIADQAVSFGTSGHRGSAFDAAFNDDHIAAITQAICEYRKAQGISGPLFLGRDSHALSLPAWSTALEVLAAHSVTVLIDDPDALTPTPAISHAIVRHNLGRGNEDPGRADGIVVTPSHNPPRDGGLKYNPPDGGPAGSDITAGIQARANDLLASNLEGVRRVRFDRALAANSTHRYDYLGTYVDDLPNVIDIASIRDAGVRIGADPLGGASVAYWEAIAERHGLELTVINPRIDPTWRFMTLDWDGRIRMDCSSPHAMSSLIANRNAFDIASGNDADSDRHGIVTPDGGLMNPNHFLAVAIDYLFRRRTRWPSSAGVGKTMVSSSMIDRVTAELDRGLFEVPVGFKWFVPGLLDASIGFGGEESAGASFLRMDGTTWTTDKDGIILALLASEILATTGSSPSQHYRELTHRFGSPVYARIDAPATRQQKQVLAALSPDRVASTDIAGEAIESVLTHAPGNGAPLGGIKVSTASSWFAARPSGTESVYKIYAESFLGEEHLAEVQQSARAIVDASLGDGLGA